MTGSGNGHAMISMPRVTRPTRRLDRTARLGRPRNNHGVHVFQSPMKNERRSDPCTRVMWNASAASVVSKNRINVSGRRSIASRSVGPSLSPIFFWSEGGGLVHRLLVESGQRYRREHSKGTDGSRQGRSYGKRENIPVRQFVLSC